MATFISRLFVKTSPLCFSCTEEEWMAAVIAMSNRIESATATRQASKFAHTYTTGGHSGAMACPLATAFRRSAGNPPMSNASPFGDDRPLGHPLSPVVSDLNFGGLFGASSFHNWTSMRKKGPRRLLNGTSSSSSMSFLSATTFLLLLSVVPACWLVVLVVKQGYT